MLCTARFLPLDPHVSTRYRRRRAESAAGIGFRADGSAAPVAGRSFTRGIHGLSAAVASSRRRTTRGARWVRGAARPSHRRSRAAPRQAPATKAPAIARAGALASSVNSAKAARVPTASRPSVRPPGVRCSSWTSVVWVFVRRIESRGVGPKVPPGVEPAGPRTARNCQSTATPSTPKPSRRRSPGSATSASNPTATAAST